ncbi:TlpA disulfide reductase family protein [Mucilaginibacter paludis]|uniref:Redoxin domain protein n=1 Tax=Mucilaginibacter paludis DSM 18603 TaxID=714943 RepID=H1Y4I3_9SPHI|nr:TlpA disulfide reductase family protein [Mucilaginibacter paludis]EHQ26767.1 Redoxin domain protein [Mucilaginibacter paludis DSM 18603]
MKKSLAIIAFLIISVQITFAQGKLLNGIWHASIKTASGKLIPFNFEIKGVDKKQMAILNGDEHFQVPDVKIQSDSVLVHLPLFDSELRLAFDGANLKGYWIRHLPQKDLKLEFAAQPGESYRMIKNPAKPLFNIEGRWSAIFASGDTTVAELKQQGARLTGTFLTTTGDYRYLEGIVAADSLYLSCFDGGHAFLFTAKINDNHTLSGGKFYAGYSGIDQWFANKNDNAKLPDAYSLTALKPGYKKIAFTFTDLNGKKVSLSDARFKNKVVILQIMGSWCPNCMDETAYMVNFYKKYQPKGVEVIGLAYERTTDFERSKKSLSSLKARFNVPYPILVTGYTNDKGEPAKSLPMLANFLAFPTTIIIDKKGDVRKIHTGFSGPGTGNYYAEFINEFEKLNDDLLAEK